MQAWTPVGNYPLGIGITYTFSFGIPPKVVVSAVVVEITDYPTPMQRKIYVLGGRGDYENGSYYKNDVWSSVNGTNWSLETSSAVWSRRSGHQALSHNGRLYVLGGYGGSNRLNDVWSSADGKNWLRETDDAGWAERSGHQALSHNGRLYVLGGSYRLNDVWSSADGKNWSRETDDAGWAWRDEHQALSHNGRLYVLGGSGNYENGSYYKNDVWSSADGKNWLRETDEAGWSRRSDHQALSHNGRLYVLGGYGGSNRLNDVWSSADGKNWLRETDDAGWAERSGHQALSHNGRLYVLGGSYRLNDVWSSANGKNWSLETDDAEWSGRYSHQAVVFPSPLVLFGVGERLTITAGVAKDLHTFTAQYGVGDYSYSLNPAVSGFAVSPGGVLSADGTAAEGRYILTVWVEDGAGNRAQTAIRVILPYFNFAAVPPLVGLAGIAKVLHTFTTDGGIAGEQYMIVAGNKEYFALDADSGVLSLLTTAWEGVYTLSVEVSDSASLSHKATAVATVEINDRGIFILGGYTNSYHRRNDVWSSADGKNWARETNYAGWVGREGHQALSHNGRLYVLGGKSSYGYSRDVWSSADGKNWSLETAHASWTRRSEHQALSHNGRLYVLGGRNNGYLNDVWSSGDGKNWSQETAHAAWTTRYGHQALSHNGRLYVLGGDTNKDPFRLNDVWSSANGKNWSLETAHAPWPRRYSHQALSHNGRLYVLGGDTNNDPFFLNDVWSSADGQNWGRETNDAKWSARHAPQAVVFPSPLVLFGVGEKIIMTAGIAANNLHSFTVANGTGNYAYSLEPAVDGFAVSSDGVLSADGTAMAGAYTINVFVVDEEDNRGQTAVRVNAIRLSLSFLDASEEWTLQLPVDHAGVLHTLTASGGYGDHTYTLSPPGSGFVIDANGVLSADGTATPGEYTITVEVADEINSHPATWSGKVIIISAAAK